MEIWKDIPEYEGLYQVSNLGRVKSLERKADNGYCIRTVKEKLIKLKLNIQGYLNVSLYKEGTSKKFTIHKLVAITFLGHKPCGMLKVVDHINNDKLDNRPENLQIITQRENSSKDKKGYSSKYVGVGWRKDINKWRARIQIDGKEKHLGYFESEEKAREAYVKEMSKL